MTATIARHPALLLGPAHIGREVGVFIETRGVITGCHTGVLTDVEHHPTAHRTVLAFANLADRLDVCERSTVIRNMDGDPR